MPSDGGKKLTIAQAARQAGMTIEGIRNAIRRGKLKAEIVATRPVYAILPQDLQAYLHRAEKEPRGRRRFPDCAMNDCDVGRAEWRKKDSLQRICRWPAPIDPRSWRHNGTSNGTNRKNRLVASVANAR
jgi:hypothetical protein